MSYTKSQFRAWVMDNADAQSSGRFDSTVGGIVDRKIGNAFDRLWSDILNAQRTIRAALYTTLSTDSQGRIALADLSDISDLAAQQRLFRVLGVTIDGAPYKFVGDYVERYNGAWAAQQPGGVGFIGDPAWGGRGYWMFGAYLYTLPIQTSHAVQLVQVNYRPTRFDQLPNETDDVDFPDGYEDLLAMEAAAEVLMKGAEETAAAAELKAENAPRIATMLEDLARQTTEPSKVRYDDSAADWGG
jgi:hypothetical protein